MLEYLKQYPTYASKTSFKDILDKIKEKEAELRQEKEYYFKAVSDYNSEISTCEKEIGKAETKFVDYDKVLEEGTSKITNSRYLKSFFYRMASEKAKQEVNLDTLNHRVNQFKNTLDIIKNQYSEYKGTMLVEMNY